VDIAPLSCFREEEERSQEEQRKERGRYIWEKGGRKVEPTIEPRTSYRLKPYQFRCPSRWQSQAVAENTCILSRPLGLVKITVLSQINTQAEWLEQQLYSERLKSLLLKEPKFAQFTSAFWHFQQFKKLKTHPFGV
jgi:hypothetical protein